MAAKYRPLNREELSSLEKEFVDYLIINGIAADEWEKLKVTEHEKAEKIVELFSDVVWEGILRKAEFLIHFSKSSLYAFHCLQDHMQLVGLDDENDQVDFTEKNVFDELSKELPEGLSIFHQSKKYDGSREYEMFKMIEDGAQINDGKIFKQLSLLYASVHSK
jgi:hypothetical protein